MFCYVNSLGAYFVWDDYSAVFANRNIRHLSLKEAFKPLYHKDESSAFNKTPVYFRPLQALSYMLDFQLWKLNAFGYHLTNVILHIANVLLVYFLLFALFKDNLLAFPGAVLFALNPAFTSSVTYVSGRADILLLLFSCLAVLAFLKGLNGKKQSIFYYIISVLCFFSALLSKEAGFSVIIFLFVLGRLVYKDKFPRNQFLVYIPFILVFLGFQLLKPASLPGFGINSLNLSKAFFGLLTMMKGACVYTFIAVFPFQLRMGRSIIAVESFADKWWLLSFVFLAFLTVSLIYGIKKNRMFLLGITWFYLPLLAMLFFNNILARRAHELLLPENNLYFPYLGFLIFVFSFFAAVKKGSYFKKIAALILLFIAPFYFALTISENTYWNDEVKLYTKILKYNKGSVFNYMVYANLGFANERVEKYGLAEKYFTQAAESSGSDPYFYNILAQFYIRSGSYDKALPVLEASKRLDDHFAQTYVLSGTALAYKGRKEEAKKDFQRALLIDPANQSASYYLGILEGKHEQK